MNFKQMYLDTLDAWIKPFLAKVNPIEMLADPFVTPNDLRAFVGSLAQANSIRNWLLDLNNALDNNWVFFQAQIESTLKELNLVTEQAYCFIESDSNQRKP